MKKIIFLILLFFLLATIDLVAAELGGTRNIVRPGDLAAVQAVQ